MESSFSIDGTEFEWESIHRLSGHPHLLFDSTLLSTADTDARIGLQEWPKGQQSSIPCYAHIDGFLNEEPESTACQDILQLDDIDWDWDCFDDAEMQEAQANVSNFPAQTDTPDGDSNSATGHSDNQMYKSVCTQDLYRSEDQKGLRVAHLLLACAEAVAGDAMDLVDVILDRLRGLVCASGSSIQRVGYYLYHALHSYAGGHVELPDIALCGHDTNYDAVVLRAFQVLVEVYPYVRFPHFTANHIILDTVAKNTKKIHILDFDILEGLQWPPFMEALSQRAGHPIQLRFTALKRADVECGSFSSMRDTARRLSEFAHSLGGMSLVFEEVQLEDLDTYAQNQDEEEVLIMNCMWELAHMTCRRRISDLTRFLQCAGRLQPAILTVAHGAFQNSGRRAPDLADRVWESLHHFSAVVDSMEGRLREQGMARAMVERIFLCPKIKRSLGIRAPDDHDEKWFRSVSEVITEHGFVKRGGLTECGLEHARALVGAYYNEDLGHGLYKVDFVRDEIVLKWGLTPLVYISAWQLTF